jgi:hypothetical protein
MLSIPCNSWWALTFLRRESGRDERVLITPRAVGIVRAIVIFAMRADDAADFLRNFLGGRFQRFCSQALPACFFADGADNVSSNCGYVIHLLRREFSRLFFDDIARFA